MMTVVPSRPSRILLLGGTTEASALAESLASDTRVTATLSLAGRTANPAVTLLPVRVGGFGGAEGLADYLRQERIDLLVDATHPFAARISTNAVAASTSTRVPLLAIERPPWTSIAGDEWIEHPGIAAAVAALPTAPQNVFSGLGRQAVDALLSAPQHRYVIRVVDKLECPPGLPHATIITSRGPFQADDDANLFEKHNIRHVLAKNSGGSAAYAKIEAARRLGIKVHMVRRPALPPRRAVPSVEEALTWIADYHRSRSDLGV